MARGLNPAGLEMPFGAFSNAAWVPAGRQLIISGLVARDEKGNLVGRGDMEAQTRQVLRNMETMLHHAGATFDDIAVVTVFLTDMSKLAVVHDVRREFFKPPYPASTLVQVVSLVDPELLIEINAVAVVPEDRVNRAAAG